MLLNCWAPDGPSGDRRLGMARVDRGPAIVSPPADVDGTAVLLIATDGSGWVPVLHSACDGSRRGSPGHGS